MVNVTAHSHHIILQQCQKNHSETRRDDPLMLATIRDDTWNVLNMQHVMTW